MTEYEKMLAGEMYDPRDPHLMNLRLKARRLFQKINSINDDSKESRDKLFYELFGPSGVNLWIEPPFFCDYGLNIEVGESVFMNFNCCILDVCKVKIGSRVMMAPSVQIYTATHPMNAKERSSGKEYGAPVTIGDDVWIGGGAIICPGVTIGHRVVIGAGAVVTKDVPNDSFAAGNPARIIKEIVN